MVVREQNGAIPLPQEERKPEITRREFLKGALNLGRAAVVTSGLYWLATLESSLQDSKERRTVDETYLPIEQDGIKINLIKYTPPLTYRVLNSEAAKAIPTRFFSIQYRVGALGENADQLFLDQGVFLVSQKDDQPEALWNDIEAEIIAKALIKARTVNGKFFNYETPGIGFQVRRVNLLFKKESNWSFHPEGRMALLALPVEDIVHINLSLGGVGEPDEDLFGEIAHKYNVHFNNLVNIWLENEGRQPTFMPALVEGMGEYADFLATGRWRLTKLSKERLEQGLKTDEGFYGFKMQDHITLAGMVIAEVEEKYPGIWAYMNHRLFLDAVEKYGGGAWGAEGKKKIFEILLGGGHPTLPLDTYLKFGDEFTKEGVTFSTWFKRQKIFFVQP